MTNALLKCTLLAVIAPLFCQSDCPGQAFFPLQRVNNNSDAAKVVVKLRSDAAAPGFPPATGLAVDDTTTDVNLAINADDSTAISGGSTAISESNSEAEILPSYDASAAGAECIAFLGGIMSCNLATGGAATITNNQDSTAQGTFKVLPNPTYPSVTGGTLQITFDVDIASFPWNGGEISASVGTASIYFFTSGGSYYSVVNLNGTPEYDFGAIDDASGTFTTTRSVAVNDTLTVRSHVSGTLNNATVTAVPSATVTTSIYVTNP
ncbi:MAG: hypothetical protein JWP89_4245 [Schlesneria sp.]|nr:hypothetical protein [Schlesneria sp.]